MNGKFSKVPSQVYLGSVEVFGKNFVPHLPTDRNQGVNSSKLELEVALVEAAREMLLDMLTGIDLNRPGITVYLVANLSWDGKDGGHGIRGHVDKL